MTRVVVVHDYLTQRGGAERVVLSMLRAFPGARLVTSIYEPSQTFPEFAEHDIETLWPDRLPLFHAHHRLALPVLASAFSRHRIHDADVVLCSSSGWAHGVRADAPKIVYCYSPARWLYQQDEYLRSASPAKLAGQRALRGRLVEWDQRMASTATEYLTLSRVVADRIQDTYGRPARIVPPPVSVDASGVQEPVVGIAPGYLLSIARLLPYKNVDAVCAAMHLLPEQRLVVVGEGPHARRLRKHAPDNVSFVGTTGDAQLRWLYANARALVSASIEDYGLTPLEANAFGVPAVCLEAGGFLDTVVSGKTGVFFATVEPAAIADAIRHTLETTFDRGALLDHAASFSEESFIDQLRDVVLPVGAQSARAGASR